MKHPILLELDKHQADEQDAWFEMSVEENDELAKQVLSFARTNFQDLEQYCYSTKFQEYGAHSTLIIILSEDESNDWNPFLLELSHHIIRKVQNGEYKKRCLHLLGDIDTSQMLEADTPMYGKFIDLFCSALEPERSDKYNTKILDALDTFVIGTPFEAMRTFDKRRFWQQNIIPFVENGNKEQREYALSIMKEFDPNYVPPRPSLLARLKRGVGL